MNEGAFSMEGQSVDINLLCGHGSIHVKYFGDDPATGFIVKSHIDGAPPLIDASIDNTNFRFRIANKLTDEEVHAINSIDTRTKIKDRTKAILTKSDLKFDRVVGDIYNNNLMMLDGDLAHVVSEALLLYYKGEATGLSEICDMLHQSNPLKFPEVEGGEGQPFYSFKFKKFLLESALGLMPKTIWHGKYEACGGYIVVQETGDLVSYHLIRKNLFENYLYRFTKFDTPSSRRHRFASIYEIDGMQFYNLNLQIRFK